MGKTLILKAFYKEIRSHGNENMTFFACLGPLIFDQKSEPGKRFFPPHFISRPIKPMIGSHFKSPFIKSIFLASSHFALPMCLRTILPSRESINVAGTRWVSKAAGSDPRTV